MLTTLRGHVELDPMSVPAPAAPQSGRENSFHDMLQNAVDAEPRPAPGTREPVAPTEAPVVDKPAAKDEADPEPADVEQSVDHTFDEQDPNASHVAEQVAATADVTETTRRGEPVRQETAGKGADSPRTSSRTMEPLIAAVVVHGATQPANGPVVAAAQSGVQGITGAKAAGDGPTRGIEGAWQRANTATRAATVAAGYRTTSASSAQLLDQARDSVFKQILLKLTPGGGEMRMKLEPPELGELDLHMIVESGNKLSLSIAAENKDMTALLQRHMDELKQTLQSAGLEVTDAQVHTRGEGSRSQQHDTNSPQHHGDDEAAAARNHLPKLGGYVTAEGLDFWV
jgi:flagellar hook-length control protein FliK